MIMTILTITTINTWHTRTWHNSPAEAREGAREVDGSIHSLYT